jgi:glycosyltransferase involved in cell wall biosynthesis
MRIAQIAPLAESVPPKLYGGTERVVAWLVEELVELGHDVTLFASGDSGTRATLVPVCPRALRLGRPRRDPTAAQTALLEAMVRRTGDFDLIHCHIDWVHLPFLSRTDIPFMTTLHGRLDIAGLQAVIDLFPDAPFISISDNQRFRFAAQDGSVLSITGCRKIPCDPHIALAIISRFWGDSRGRKAQKLPFELHALPKCPSAWPPKSRERIAVTLKIR